MIEISAVVFTKEQYNDGTFDRLLLVYVYYYFSPHSNHEVMFFNGWCYHSCPNFYRYASGH